MKKISASVFFIKNIFPIIWLGCVALFIFASTYSGAVKDWGYVAAPVFMTIFGYVLMRKIVWVLVDEVYDCGNYLLVKNQDEEDKINLSDIMNISVVTAVNPPRISLRLRRPSKFGNEISFSPITNRSRLKPFRKNEIVEDLIVRIEKARSSQSLSHDASMQ